MWRTDRPSCECGDCREACARMPGWFAPNEIEPAAAAMGLTAAEFVRQHCTVDYLVGTAESGGEIFVLRPANIDDRPGEMARPVPFGQCKFFIEERCAIHATKPMECAVSMCSQWEDGDHSRIGKLWDNAEAQRLIREWIGFEPAMPQFSIADVFEIIRRGMQS